MPTHFPPDRHYLFKKLDMTNPLSSFKKIGSITHKTLDQMTVSIAIIVACATAMNNFQVLYT